MHQRFLSWLVLGIFVATCALRAQAPAAAASGSTLEPGLVLVAKIQGTVTKALVGQPPVTLKLGDKVEQRSKIKTALRSSVVLLFSNGATVRLGDDTELDIEEFLHDPFGKTITIAETEEEPSRSNTRLRLHRGELVGKVAKLRHDLKSTFDVHTPVGAAGIRGTTFRIVFRPQGTGQAFSFHLSTLQGDVVFTPSAQGGGPPPPVPGQPLAPGQGLGGGISVVSGQEYVFDVTATMGPTGQVEVTVPPVLVASTTPISAETQARLSQYAQEIAVATEKATFTSPAKGQTTGGGTTGTIGGDSPQQQQQQQPPPQQQQQQQPPPPQVPNPYLTSPGGKP